MNLFENIILDLLIEAKSPEEILGILKHKFTNVPEKVIDAIFSIDPTKKKSYTQWILLHWDEEKHTIDEALQYGMFKKLFAYLQRTPDTQLSKYPTVKDALYLVSNIDLLSKSSDDELANDFDIVYKSPEWVIAVPNTYEASHKLGENTDWCTAGYKYSNGRMYYNKYLEDYDGKYYINFDFRGSERLNGIEYPFKRYQFHFESKQFMDAHDNPISVDDINMPDSVFEFYEKHGYDMNDMDNYEDRLERYNEARWSVGIPITERLMLLPEYDEDLDPNIPEDADFYVFDQERDTRDPISYYVVSKQPLFVDQDNGFCIFNRNLEGRGWVVPGTSADIDEYDGTSEDKPVIVVGELGHDYGGRSDEFNIYDDISYYKVLEVFGKNTLFFVVEDRGGDKNLHIQSEYYEDEYINLPGIEDLKISDIFINHEVGALLYDNNVIFEVVYNNGYHSLIIFKNSGLNYLVKCDIPANNGRYFVEEEDENGNSFILGTIRNYPTNGAEEENTASPVGFKQDLYFNNLIIVEMSDGTNNVYSTKKQHVLFKQNFAEIKSSYGALICAEKLKVIIAKEPGQGYAVYSLISGEQLTQTYPMVDCGVNNFYGWVGAKDNEKNFYIFSQDFKNTFGPFTGLYREMGKTKVMVSVTDKNGKKSNKIFNFITGNFEFEDVGMLSSIIGSSTLVGGMKSNGETIIFDFESGQIVDRNIMPGSRIQRYVDKAGTLIGVRHSDTGKSNIISLKTYEKLLPFDVDKIYDSLDNTKAFYPYIGLYNEGRYYVYNTNDGSLLPENGIATGETEGVFSFGFTSSRPVCYFKIHDGYDSPEYYVMWDYSTNELFVNDNTMGDWKRLKLCEPEVQQRVMQAVYPQKAQFVSQYNEMINRMKKLLR